MVGPRLRRRPKNPDGRMPVMDHLRELRNRLLKAIIVIAIGMGIALYYSNPTIQWVMRPFCSATINGHSGCHIVGDSLVANGVFDPLFIRIKIAFFIALIATLAPAQIWAYLGVVFAVVIIGRLGNPLGALLAGLLIGASESIAMAVLAPAWAPVVSFSVLIAILLWDPEWL